MEKHMPQEISKIKDLAKMCASRPREFGVPLHDRLIIAAATDLSKRTIFLLLSREEWQRSELDSRRSELAEKQVKVLTEGKDVDEEAKEKLLQWLEAVAKEAQQRFLVCLPSEGRLDVSPFRLEFLERVIEKMEREGLSIDKANEKVKDETERFFRALSYRENTGEYRAYSWILGRTLTPSDKEEIFEHGARTSRADYEWIGTRESGMTTTLMLNVAWRKKPSK